MSWYDQDYLDVVTTGTPIWDNIFMVKVATKNVQSTEQLKHFGLPSMGDERLDRQMHNELVTVMLTIDAIFEKWKSGIPLFFVHNADSERVYQIVFDYLSAWERQLARGVNIGGAPVDDLIRLDEFAAKLFEQSRMFNGARTRGSFSFIESLKQRGGFVSLVGNKLTMMGKGRDGGEIKPDAVDQHTSFAEAFAAVRFIRGKAEPTNVPVSDRWGS